MDQATKTVVDNCHSLGEINVAFMDASGYVLAEDVYSTEPHPPFPASIKDGYAVIGRWLSSRLYS